MRHFSARVSIIDKFARHFKGQFSKTQFIAFTALLYALIKEYKRVNLSTLAQALGTDYEKLQYFLSDSKWDYEAVNAQRIELLKNQRTTGFSKEGALIIDDTGVLKPYASKTEGVAYQHCPVLGTEALCNVAVASCYSVNDRYIPLEVKFYKTESEFIMGKNDPDFKSKLELAKELIADAVDKKIPFRHILFDAWYPASDVLTFIQERELKFISEVKSDRLMYFRNPEARKSYFMQQDELVKLIKKHLWHKVKSFMHRGELISVYAFSSRLKSTDFPVKVFVALNNTSQEVRTIISNDLELAEKEAVITYFERWAIERVFRELKDSIRPKAIVVLPEPLLTTAITIRGYFTNLLSTSLRQLAR